MRAIITFHSIDNSGSLLSYAPSALAALLTALEKKNIPICDLDTLLQEHTSKGIALTFDDGMASLYENALPILRDHNVPAHLFLTVNAVSKSNRWSSQPDSAPTFKMLNWQQLETCHKAGVIIEGHTCNHADLRTLSDAEALDECQHADDMIQSRLGRKPRYFAYPYGYYDQRIQQLLTPQYQAIVTTKLRPLRNQEDFSALPRLDSYYLQMPWLYNRLTSPVSRCYLTLRSIIRTLRGH